MAKKVKLTRPELKLQRDTLTRFQRYLPMLKLKQQQLQMTIRQINQDYLTGQKEYEQARAAFDAYQAILHEWAGVNVEALASCREIKTAMKNVAGVNIPVFIDASFERLNYNLFATPPWVDRTIADLRQVNICEAKLKVLEEQVRLLKKELTKIVQRVNLFEKVKIPEAREIIRRIRIQLSDEMAAAVGRAKIAKGKLAESESSCDCPEGACECDTMAAGA